MSTVLSAQTCTTQAKMSIEDRTALADQSLSLASLVKANDSAKLQAAAVTEFATNFTPTTFLIRTASEKLSADSLRVAQVYRLEATTRKAGDTSAADFSCPLKDSAAEVDFSIGALPPGVYGFAIVDADGPQPWQLSFLLRQEGSVWKMAGIISHSRAAAGHDGFWYWTTAREKARSSQPLLAWLLYGEADSLLRPAGYMTSTNLDKLTTEQSAAAPPELSDGLSAQTPLILKGADGAEFRVTGLSTAVSDDGKRLNLMLHLSADWLADPAAANARNMAAAKALLDAHKDLRKSFDGVWVFAESAGRDPFATEQPIATIP